MKGCGKTLLLLFLFSLPLTGCSTPEAETKVSYEETKKMVIDILKTDDGKKALKEVLADEELKQELVLDSAVVAQTIESTLVSNKGKDFWKKAFEDPEFVKTFAQSMREESKNLLKDLMKDPDYRGQMLELMHDPEMEKELAELLKSQDYRKHVKSVVTETLDSPLYQAKIEEILLKAADEKSKKEEDQDSES